MRLFLFLLFAGATCFADSPEGFGPEARAAYLRMQQSIQRAQINYMRELNIAMETAHEKRDYEQAKLIKDEIEKMRDTISIISTDNFIGRTYERMKGKDSIQIAFKENGHAVLTNTFQGKKTVIIPVSWRRLESGVVAITGKGVTNRFWTFSPSADTASVRFGNNESLMEAKALE